MENVTSPIQEVLVSLVNGSYLNKMGNQGVIVKKRNIVRDLIIGIGGALIRDVTDNLHRLVLSYRYILKDRNFKNLILKLR